MTLSATSLSHFLGDSLIEPSSPTYDQELSVVKQLWNKATVSHIVLLTGYAYEATDDNSDQAKELVVAAGKAHIKNFNGGDTLCRRFAAAAVIDLMKGYNGPTPVAAALAARAAAVGGLRPSVPDLGPVSEASVARLAEQMRRISFDSLSVQPFPPGKSGELPADNPNAITSAAVRAVAQEQRNMVRAAATNLEKRLDDLERLARRNSEEIDLLWWALDPFSDYIDEWSAGGNEATVPAALEVGRRLLVDPPPRGIPRVLHEALVRAGADPAEQLTLRDVVDQVPSDALADERLSGGVDGWAVPVLSCLQRRRDGEDAGDRSDSIASRLEWAVQLVADMSLTRVSL